MIIRQRLTANFTVLPNELLNDPGLSLDAIAAMGRLLALPHDWTVCLQDLRRRWGCGLERLKRIMRELIAAGWVQRMPPRKLPNGSFSRGDYKVFNVRQEVQDDLPLDDTEGTGSAASASLESARPESGDPESVGRTPNIGRIHPRTDSPKPNPPREKSPAPGRRPASAHADAAPDGALSLQAVLCPDDFLPEGRHYAAAEAAGFDRAFVRERAEAIRLWSRANAHQPKAWKTDWSLAFDGMLKTALREAAERRQREAVRSRPPAQRASTHGALALLVDMHGADHDAHDDRHSHLDLSPVIDDAGDGCLRGPVPQPTGGPAARFRAEALAGLLGAEC